MKPEQNTIRNHAHDIDAEISALLAKELPRANSNPWFTPRVMNRLPEQSRWSRISLWQWVCYILGIGALIATAVISGKWLIHTELSLLTQSAGRHLRRRHDGSLPCPHPPRTLIPHRGKLSEGFMT